MPWIALGTLAVISNDEGDHLQVTLMLLTPFNALLQWCGAHTTRTRVRLPGLKRWSRIFFPKLFLDCLGY